RELATAGFDEVIRTAAAALPEVSGPDAVDLLEVAVLERSPVDRPLTGRTFKRRGKDEILRALAGKDGA
ncbi:MAG: proteasome subunit alpha, partial [Micrococcaceae bacterium]|nr:proteasome subunit alpha [Micrococcaceae bacterium]